MYLNVMNLNVAIRVDPLTVHLYESKSESNIATNLLHCFQSVCLYCSDSSSDEDQRKNRFGFGFRSSINAA